MAKIIEEPSLRNREAVFNDRFHAGELLAEKLRKVEGLNEAIILAVPAGGVQVAKVVSEKLSLPFDLAITRKLHVPWNKEAGFGAISWDGTLFLNEPLIASLGLTRDEIDHCVAEEQQVIRKRMNRYRGDKPFPDLKSRAVIIIDDGLASGFSMLTTLKTIEQMDVKEKIVAVPTAPVSAINLIKPYADTIICLNIRSGKVFAVADAYKEWYDLEDEEVMDLLTHRSTNRSSLA